jgi:RNA polymerase sigma-70 factor (ECF subfamily)
MHMPSTMWTAILRVRQEPEQVKELVVKRYRDPIYQFTRQQGLSHEDSEDVAQEVFLRVCREEFLVKADRTKGKFRTLLLAVTKHVIGSLRQYVLAEKRDRRRQVALDDFDVPEALESDGAFDRLWAANLVRQARETLKDDPAVQALNLQLEGKSYRDIAAALGKQEHDITNFLHRAKQRIRREVERLVSAYTTEDEVRDEIAALFKFL